MVQVRRTGWPPITVTGGTLARWNDAGVTVTTGCSTGRDQIVVSGLGIGINTPRGRGVTRLAVINHGNRRVTGHTIVKLWVLCPHRIVVSGRRITLVTGDTTGRTGHRHDNAFVTEVTIDVLCCCVIVVIGPRISSPAGIAVTGFAAGDNRQAGVTILTTGRSDDRVVLITR